MLQKTRTITIIAILVSLAALSLAAQQPSLDDVLPSISAADRSSLLTNGELLRFHAEGMSPGLLPNTSLTATVARRLISGDLNIGIEGLFFTSADVLPSLFKSMPADERELILYNILRSVSTLQGLEYYSASRGEMRLLFEESWAISDPNNSKEALADPLVTAIPPRDSFFIHQKDKSFGNNQSEMTFLAESNVFASDVINLSTMRYKGIIKVVDSGNMQVHLIVVPVEEGLLMYGTMSAQTRNVKSFIDRARDSFTNRVIALTGWYRARLEEEFAR
jgi:hypothetical protein